MQSKPPIHTRQRQRGITLIEALIALLILALGVLGLAAVQARMLVETRTTNSRATAIRLIADLGERIRMNAAGAQPAATNSMSPYAYSGDSSESFLAAPDTSEPPDPDCASEACSPAQQAAYDLWFWRAQVARSLMSGLTSIAQVGPQQLRIIVAWRLNENTSNALDSTNPETLKLSRPLTITNPEDENSLCRTAPDADIDSYICHVDFIEIPALN